MMACWWRRVKMRMREWRERRNGWKRESESEKDWVCDAMRARATLTDCDGWWLFGASVSGRKAADATSSSSFTISLPPLYDGHFVNLYISSQIYSFSFPSLPPSFLSSFFNQPSCCFIFLLPFLVYVHLSSTEFSGML